MLSKVLAKSDEQNNVHVSLTDHTEDVISRLKVLQKRTSGLSDRFWSSALLACLFHDAGKITNNFKEVLAKRYKNNVRHELISGIYLILMKQKLTAFDLEDEFIFSVFSHHKKLNGELFAEVKGRTLSLECDLINEWFEYAYITAAKNNISLKKFHEDELDKICKLSATDYLAFFQNYFNNKKTKWNSSNRLKYVDAKAVLNISDWLASGNIKIIKDLIYEASDLKKKIKERFDKSQKGERIKTSSPIEFYEFQKRSKITGNVLATAPTGSGKTEAALLWASVKDPKGKIIYCLPTKVTSLSIYNRICDYFGAENASIVHSSAFLYQKSIDENYDNRKYLLDRTFFSNITVCTIDQILTQGFNLGFWEVKTFHCRNAKIIIDEIHLYSPYTLALILQTIKYFRTHFNAEFYIMSATMPIKLKELLISKAFGGMDNITIIEDKENLDNRRNTFEIRDILIQQNLDEIKKQFGPSKKILVVLNTVKQAIDVYETLRDEAKAAGMECICYHSKFIQKDRTKKEKQIFDAEKKDKGILLIATQVVEVSLDIDFDILFTENAPIDAVIQRAGRVNRKGKKSNTYIIVHKHSQESSKWVYSEKNILDKTFDALQKFDKSKISESKFLELVNQVYAEIDVTTTDFFKEGMTGYQSVQESNRYIGDSFLGDENVLTREIDSISVIPSQFYEELKGKDKIEKSQYELNIHSDQAKKYRVFPDTEPNHFFKYIDCPYNFEIGLNQKKNDPNNEFFKSF